MKSSKDYKPNSNVAVLIVGDPGSGKTRLGMAVPRPAILDCDGNLRSALRLDPSKEFVISTGFLKDDGTEVPIEQRWTHCTNEVKLLLKSMLKGEADCFFLDGLSNLCRWGLIHAEKKLEEAGINVRKEYLAKYQSFIPLLTDFITTIRIPQKPVFVTVHQVTDKDEFGRMRYYLDIPGRLAETLGGQFTDVWGMFSTPDPTNAKTLSKYEIRTRPSGYHVNLKTSSDFEPAINITDKSLGEIWKTLEGKLSINLTAAGTK